MKKFKIILIACFIALVLFIGYRYFYGERNSFVSPDTIDCYGRRYDKSHSIKTFTEEEKPKYLIISLHLLEGKRLYTSQPKGTLVPTVIYLYIGDGRYETYGLSGGP